MGDVSVQRSIRFPDELAARIAELAAADDRDFSYVVVKTLEKALGSLAEGAPVEGKGRREAGAEKAPRSPVSVPASPQAPEPPMDRAEMFRQMTERGR